MITGMVQYRHVWSTCTEYRLCMFFSLSQLDNAHAYFGAIQRMVMTCGALHRAARLTSHLQPARVAFIVAATKDSPELAR